MTIQQKSYLAGLLDGDGSIMLQLKKRKDAKYKFRIKTVIVFYQATKYVSELNKFRSLIGSGYLYQRNDQISELRVVGHAQVKQLLVKLNPYLRFKRDQALLMIQAIDLIDSQMNLEKFLAICDIADRISKCNYSSKLRKNTAEYVRSVLIEHKLIPVTTGSST